MPEVDSQLAQRTSRAVGCRADCARVWRDSEVIWITSEMLDGLQLRQQLFGIQCQVVALLGDRTDALQKLVVIAQNPEEGRFLQNEEIAPAPPAHIGLAGLGCENGDFAERCTVFQYVDDVADIVQGL